MRFLHCCIMHQPAYTLGQQYAQVVQAISMCSTDSPVLHNYVSNQVPRKRILGQLITQNMCMHGLNGAGRDWMTPIETENHFMYWYLPVSTTMHVHGWCLSNLQHAFVCVDRTLYHQVFACTCSLELKKKISANVAFQQCHVGSGVHGSVCKCRKLCMWSKYAFIGGSHQTRFKISELDGHTHIAHF